VCLASPSNAVQNRVVTREPVASLADFKAKGLRIADTNLISSHGIASHDRLNHIIDVMRQGYAEGEAEWIEVGAAGERGAGQELQARLIDSVRTGKADAAFAGRIRPEAAPDLHILELPELPMINGTTITTSYEALHQKEGLAERLVRAMVETVHFTRVHPEEAQRFLDVQDTRPYSQAGGRIESITRSPIKPYPSPEGVMNAWELSRMRYEDGRPGGQPHGAVGHALPARPGPVRLHRRAAPGRAGERAAAVREAVQADGRVPPLRPQRHVLRAGGREMNPKRKGAFESRARGHAWYVES
jgi:hypothetical protein